MSKKKAMKKKEKSPVKAAGEKIKVQLDYRTIIFLRNKNALKFWMSRYPNARIID